MCQAFLTMGGLTFLRSEWKVDWGEVAGAGWAGEKKEGEVVGMQNE